METSFYCGEFTSEYFFVMVNFGSLRELISGNKSDHELSNCGYPPLQHSH